MLNERLPRIVSVKQMTLVGGAALKSSYFSNVAVEAMTLLEDHEFRILLIWAVVSPLAALAYLVWKKYDALKWLAIPLFAVGLVHFVYQWGGFYAAAHKYLSGW